MPAFPPILAHGSPYTLLLLAGGLVAVLALSVGLMVAGVRLRRRDSKNMRRLGVGLIVLGLAPAWAIAIVSAITLFRHGSA